MNDLKCTERRWTYRDDPDTNGYSCDYDEVVSKQFKQLVRARLETNTGLTDITWTTRLSNFNINIIQFYI